MVVSNLHIPRSVIFPPKAYSPLVVDTDAVLSCAIALQSLQPITRRYPQFLKVLHGVKDKELAARLPLDA